MRDARDRARAARAPPGPQAAAEDPVRDRDHAFDVAGAEGYMTASTYPDDGVGEVFLKLGKQGSTLAGVMDAFSMAISVGLQYGIPLESYVASSPTLRFEPAGMTDDPDIRIAQSMMDYIFRRLALDHLPYDGAPSSASSPPPSGPPSSPARTRPRSGVEVDPVELAQSAAVEELRARRGRAPLPAPAAAPAQATRRSGASRGEGSRSAARRPAHHGRADRVPAGPHRGRPAVPHLRHEDAPGRQLLRLRRLRLHQRLQLKVSGIASDATRDVAGLVIRLTSQGKPCWRFRPSARRAPTLAGAGARRGKDSDCLAVLRQQ